uniref:Serine protease n=1 Tax=Sanxia water strider virus 11 TaxID=1923395 RepID=A0A1L3KEX5_9VIRU|nr:hypothetical protein 1 [Sanxia water strider virus 11]
MQFTLRATLGWLWWLVGTRPFLWSVFTYQLYGWGIFFFQTVKTPVESSKLILDYFFSGLATVLNATNPATQYVVGEKARYFTLLTDPGYQLNFVEVPNWHMMIYIACTALVAVQVMLFIPVLIFNVCVLLVKTSTRVNRLKMRTLEAILQPAEAEEGAVPPSFQMEVRTSGFFPRLVGQAIRMRDFLVVPSHVLNEIRKESDTLIVAGQKGSLRLPVDSFFSLHTDISVTPLALKAWTLIGASKAKPSYKVSGLLEVVSMGKRNCGSYWEGKPAFMIETKCNTEPGFSGAAYVDCGSLIGIHIGEMTTGVNGGMNAQFVDTLLAEYDVPTKTAEASSVVTTESDDSYQEDSTPTEEVDGKTYRKTGKGWKIDPSALRGVQEDIDRDDRIAERIERMAEEEGQKRYERLRQKIGDYANRDNCINVVRKEIQSGSFGIIKEHCLKPEPNVLERFSQLESVVNDLSDAVRCLAFRDRDYPGDVVETAVPKNLQRPKPAKIAEPRPSTSKTPDNPSPSTLVSPQKTREFEQFCQNLKEIQVTPSLLHRVAGRLRKRVSGST